MRNKIILLSCFLALSSVAFSQKEVRKQLKEGNKEYKQEKYTEAEIAYRKALKGNASSPEAAYNLGNSLYKQGKFPEALEQYQVVTNAEKDKGKVAHTWHNVGNIFMDQQEYAKSIEAYKKSLRLNPNDNETRYNLALAQKLLQEEEGGDDDNNEDQNQNQDQDQERDQDQDDQQQDQDQQQQQDQQNEEQQQEQQEQEQQQDQMSRDNAEQILDALLQDEKDIQEKVQEAQRKKVQTQQTDKNW